MAGIFEWLLPLILVTYLTGWIAQRRGRSITMWYWLGAIFGPVALLAAALMPHSRNA